MDAIIRSRPNLYLDQIRFEKNWTSLLRVCRLTWYFFFRHRSFNMYLHAFDVPSLGIRNFNQGEAITLS